MQDEKLSFLFNKVSERHTIIKASAEKKFMTEHTFIEVHCIELIEKLQDANVTKLAKAFKMTRGAISKITKRLINAGAIETYQKPENKKEIYFKLTNKGKVINDEHEEMHKDRIQRDSIIFSKLSEAEKATLLNLLEKINQQLVNELKLLGMDDYL